MINEHTLTSSRVLHVPTLGLCFVLVWVAPDQNSLEGKRLEWQFEMPVRKEDKYETINK